MLTKKVYYYRLNKKSIIIDLGGEEMELRLCDSEYRFMMLIWENEPVKSGDLVKISKEKLGWKKSTTYTVIKKLSERGFIKNEETIVTALVSKEECQAVESEYFMERTFEGSLPGFVAAFLGGKTISQKEAEEIKKLIDAHREE